MSKRTSLYTWCKTNHKENIIKEWDFSKNESLGFDMNRISCSSGKKVWWICSNGHNWQAMISNRIREDAGCPYCSNKKVLKGFNDLATTNPKLASEWNYKKNGSLTPFDITLGSNKRVWWVCSKGHEWLTSVCNRKRNDGCPYCSNKKIQVGYNDLATTKPKVIHEWNYEKNGSITPNNVVEGSIKKVWWVCSKGHEYRMSIKDKTLKNSKCPYCSNVKAYAGFNDLLTTNPDIAKEWDYTNNGELKLSDVLAGSHKKVWWVCKNKHHYQAIVKSRTSGSGCPFCSKHMKTSFPEQAVFYYVNKLFSDAINGYIISDRRMELDIYIPSKKIGIEYDGSNYHNDNKSLERDNKKYSICKTKGITLIRLSEKEKTSSLRKCDYRINVISRQSDDLNKAIDELANFLGKNINSNVDKDRNEILINLDKRNVNLAEKYPFILNEWNYEKNDPLLPENVSPNSNTVVWWKCDKGHEWKSTIANRTSHNKKCPYCANVKLLKGFNDLSTTNPKLASEWNYSKNGKKKPSDYFGHANIMIWWKCNKGHEWKTTINSRSYGSNCPYCAKQKVLSGINDLATLKPEVLSKWNYQKNTIEPKDVFAHSSKMVWWVCDKGHEWQAPVSRVSKGSDCPYCSNTKLLSGYNDLQTINPSLAREWNYRKNGTLKPSQVLFGSAKKVWWICDKGHEWRTQINIRNNGCNCPTCSRKMINSSSKRKVLMIDLKTNQVIKEFDSISDASKSFGVSPSNISAVCLKKPKRKSCGGYKWEFKE